jgi:hypothetical protein
VSENVQTYHVLVRFVGTGSFVRRDEMIFEILIVLGILFSLLFIRELWRYIYYPHMHGPNPIPVFGKFEFLNFNIIYQTYETLDNMKKYPRMYMTKDLALVSYFVHDIQLIKEIVI